MCGIAGARSVKQITESQIQQLTNQLAHRGPDASGYFFNDSKHVALGHRRLSVIDLSTAANQPMFSGSERFVMVFNGEIYNFRELRKVLEGEGCSFHTSSDSEVILAAFEKWGAKAASRFNGMFAIAIYDKQKDILTLMRDRFGKKPIYYYLDDQQFVFASEVKSILAFPEIKKDFDTTGLQQFLHLGYVPEPYTSWKYIRKFPAGCYGELSSSLQLNIHRYWNLEVNTAPLQSKNEDDVLKNFKSILTSAVERRMISDVPLGALLSGGTDSSLVCAIASTLTSQKLNTFTIGFDDAKFNESVYAEKVSNKLGTQHHSFILKEKEAIDLVEKYLHHFDEPFADSSAIPTMLVSQIARQSVTVALTGDGGDELFLGYGSYTWAERVASYKMFGPLASLLSWTSPSMAKASAMLSGKGRDHIFSVEQGFFTYKELKHLLISELSLHGLSGQSSPRSTEDLSPAEQQALFDITHYLKDDLLVKVDRASMYYSLECRCPLLDPEVVSFALNLPREFKLRNDTSKYLMKKLLSTYLPENLVYRKKWGFGIPLATWLRNDLRYLIDQYLSVDLVKEFNFVKFEAANKIVSKFLSGDNTVVHKLWVLIVIHFWFKHNAKA